MAKEIVLVPARSVTDPAYGLTVAQEAFVMEYMVDLNASHAAVRIGLTAKDGTKVMKQPGVARAIARAMAERSKRVGLNADRVLDRLGAIVNGDVRRLFNAEGRIKSPHEYDADDAMLIAGVKTRRIIEKTADGKPQEVEVQEIKFVDQTTAIQLAMRHLGMLKDQVDINVVGLADRLRRHQAIRDGVVVDGDVVVELGASDTADDTGGVGDMAGSDPQRLTADDVI